MIGKYRIAGLLGRGGMGRVYKALIPELGRMVALKLLDPNEHLVDLLGWEEVERRFVREARFMARLRHRHIAAVWDLDRDCRDRPFFVMEYYCNNLGAVIGESYRVEETSRRLPLDAACGYALQTLDALARMHHAGMVHRDVKPYNLLLTDDDEVKLIDFGLSKLRGETGPGGPRTLKVGSPYYTAPELERDPALAEPRADLYSTAVTLYRALTGCLPPEPDAEGDRAPRCRVWPSHDHPDLDAEWDDFFQTALAPAPEARFASARAMAQALQGLLDRWQERVAAICRLPETEQAPAGAPLDGPPRAEPVRTGTVDAAEAFGLDALARPRQYAANELRQRGDGTVEDRASGLVWQREGSEYPLSMEEAAAHVEALNAQRFGGAADWRLPTVDELVTITRPVPSLGDFCVAPAFGQEQRILWSADRRSYTSAWYLHAAMGFVGWQDFTCRFWVRAVRRS